MKSLILGFIVATVIAVSGCSPRDSAPEVSTEATSEEVSTDNPATFINRVWEVAESDQVALGSLRAFLSEGTLVMADPNSTPALGAWSFQNGRLTITEEGLEYDVDILELTQDAFRIRIHNPGEPIEMRLAPAEQPPLPGDSQ